MRCFVCNQTQWKLLYQDIEKCINCGFVKAEDEFFGIISKKVYGRSYYNNGQYANYEKERLALLKNFKDRLIRILKYKNSGNLLDVGCAYGYFLSVAKKHFSVTGIDLDKEITSTASSIAKVKVLDGDFLRLKLVDAKYDVVTFFDSIEHFPNPRKAITIAHSYLRKNGVIVIETADIESALARIQRRKWRIIDPSVHLSYFSRRTLVELLKSSGFEVLEVSYVPFSRSFAQILSRLISKRVPIFDWFYKIPITINTYDLFVVVALKK